MKLTDVTVGGHYLWSPFTKWAERGRPLRVVALSGDLFNETYVLKDVKLPSGAVIQVRAEPTEPARRRLRSGVLVEVLTEQGEVLDGPNMYQVVKPGHLRCEWESGARQFDAHQAAKRAQHDATLAERRTDSHRKAVASARLIECTGDGPFDFGALAGQVTMPIDVFERLLGVAGRTRS